MWRWVITQELIFFNKVITNIFPKSIENIIEMCLNDLFGPLEVCMDKFLISKEDSVLVIVDVQDRLAAAMKEKDNVINNCLHLIEIAKMYSIPVLLTEQYPKGLGRTVEAIRKAVSSYEPFEKLSFSCCGEDGFIERLRSTGRKKVILTGMETHVCVLQTCLDLLKAGFNIHLAKDAGCSRTKENWNIGAEFMRDAGAVITCTETVLFQLLGVAGSEEFRTISKRIR